MHRIVGTSGALKIHKWRPWKSFVLCRIWSILEIGIVLRWPYDMNLKLLSTLLCPQLYTAIDWIIQLKTIVLNNMTVWIFTLYIGCTAGSCLRVATQNTSITRWVLSRWDSTWNTWNSEWRTHILASSHARGGSLGRNMGVSRLGVCSSWG